jgi:hypothetical protein
MTMVGRFDLDAPQYLLISLHYFNLVHSFDLIFHGLLQLLRYFKQENDCNPSSISFVKLIVATVAPVAEFASSQQKSGTDHQLPRASNEQH